MKVKGSRRLVARLGLALAVAAIAVPSASAMNAKEEGGGSARLYADDVHAVVAPVPSRFQRLYADDLHAPLVSVSLAPSNVRTDSATVPVSLPASNVRTDAPSLLDSIPRTNAPRLALLTPKAPSQPAPPESSGIDWSVAGIGAGLGAFGLMLLIGVVYFTGRHNRSRLAAT